MRPLVSVITPAYRAANSIDRTIASVSSQSVTDWQMLVVDDASPDDTGHVVTQWARKDSRIALLQLSKNGGPARARNEAIRESKGQFLAFLDSDDSWPPEKLERQLAFMRATGAVISYTAYHRASGDPAMRSAQIHIPRRLTYRDLLGNTAIATSTVVLDRDRLGWQVQMKPVFYDDFALWCDILRAGHIAHGLDEDLMEYAVVPGSYSRNKARSAREVWRAYRQVERLGMAYSVWCFARYAVRGSIKYMR